jgi:hypothetical protein
MRGSKSFKEATGKSTGQWNQLTHYPLPVVSKRNEVITEDQFTVACKLWLKINPENKNIKP